MSAPFTGTLAFHSGTFEASHTDGTVASAGPEQYAARHIPFTIINRKP